MDRFGDTLGFSEIGNAIKKKLRPINWGYDYYKTKMT